MPKNKLVVTLALAAVLMLAGVAVAEHHEKTVTLEGQIACAKCTLNKEDAQGCQNVLVVKKGDTEEHYYLVDNEVSKEYGHVCQGYKGAVVTGTVAEKDGKMWLTASKMSMPDKG